jgi:hypothetical protein
VCDERTEDVEESEMWVACAGIRYCAYDHSESKYLGNGKNGVSGDKDDCRFLHGESKPSGVRRYNRLTMPRTRQERICEQFPCHSKRLLPSRQAERRPHRSLPCLRPYETPEEAFPKLYPIYGQEFPVTMWWPGIGPTEGARASSVRTHGPRSLTLDVSVAAAAA